MPQRSDLSREAMKKATAALLLQEPLAKITVRQIVQTARIARSTFYRNFDDKEDFLAWLQQDLVHETSSRLVGTPERPTDFTTFYQYAAANREFMKAFLVGQRWPAFVQALYGQATAHYQTIMAGLQHTVPDKALAAFALCGHINLFATWLQSDDHTPPEQMGEYHRRLAAGIMHDLQ